MGEISIVGQKVELTGQSVGLSIILAWKHVCSTAAIRDSSLLCCYCCSVLIRASAGHPVYLALTEHRDERWVRWVHPFRSLFALSLARRWKGVWKHERMAAASCRSTSIKATRAKQGLEWWERKVMAVNNSFAAIASSNSPSLSQLKGPPGRPGPPGPAGPPGEPVSGRFCFIFSTPQVSSYWTRSVHKFSRVISQALARHQPTESVLGWKKLMLLL